MRFFALLIMWLATLAIAVVCAASVYMGVDPDPGRKRSPVLLSVVAVLLVLIFTLYQGGKILLTEF
jgi:hypothetical protein